MERKFDLENRLIDFAATIIKTAEGFPKSYAGNHLAGQLTRSGSSPALNYGEAQGAESRNDFIHKMKIALKELRETNNGLKIVLKLNWTKNDKIELILKECNELISIFVKSIETAKNNNQAKK